MKIAVHITFFFVESRLGYLRQVVESLSKLPHEVRLFIYSNKDLKGYLETHKNIEVKIYPYKKSGLLGYNQGIWNKLGLTSLVHPYYLAWENRNLIEKMVDDFDVQMYLEDDIEFGSSNFLYWMKHKDICMKNGYNLGFLRVEFDQNNKAFLTDILQLPKKIIEIENQSFLLNDNSPYCGFWIYERSELKEFIKTKEWKFDFTGLGIRENPLSAGMA